MPDGGVQPEARVDARGGVHLIYLGGAPGTSDVFYIHRAPGQHDFSKPLRVNSIAGSAIALGTVRGAHLALGRNGRVHVAWNGNGSDAKMQYARMNPAGTAFEPQISVMTHTSGLDGGGTIAADEMGNVYVAWHARGDVQGESHRRVYLAKSTNDGTSFAPEVPISDERAGACGCCGMAALAAHGQVQFLYRSAGGDVHRDIHLLTSKNNGASFDDKVVQTWELSACPMSTENFTDGKQGIQMAWENQNQIYFSPSEKIRSIEVPGDPKNRKHPAIAESSGRILLAWTEGTSYRTGGSLAWREFDAAGKPIAEQGSVPGVPAHSDVAVFATPDGRFSIVY